MRFRLLIAGVLAPALLMVPAVDAEEWSRFRGPNGSGVSKDSGFPTEFGRDQGVLWRTPVRPGKSSPILTERHIFLTAFDNGKLWTLCFDREDGKLLWEREESRPRDEVANVRNEPASITPVTDGQNVYVFFKDLGLISYDAGGKVRWKVPLGPFTNSMGLASSPIIDGDSVVLVADQEEGSYIAAFDRSNGEIRWKTGREEKDGWASPVLYRAAGAPPLILTASRGQFGAHLLDTGKRTWSEAILSPAIVASPVVDQDTVFTFGYGQDAATPFSTPLARYDKNHDGVLSPDEYATDPFVIAIGRFGGNRDGIVTKEKWDEKQRKLLVPSSLVAIRLEHDTGSSGDPIRPRELWRYEKNFVGVVPSPLLYEGVLYIIRNGGILTSFDAGTGEVLKTGRVPGAVGGYSASPVAADGRVFLASDDGKVAVLRAGRDWDVLRVNDVGEGCYATPALSGGNIYLRTAEALYCFAGAYRSPAGAGNPVILENQYVKVSKNAAPCAVGGGPRCDDRVVVALRALDLTTPRGARKMQRGDIAVFEAAESYMPPDGGDYLEVVLKQAHPPVRSPAVLIPPEKNSLLYDGERFFVFEEKLPPGETRARHSHSRRVVVVLNETRLEQWPEGEREVFRNQVPDDVHFNEPVIHAVKTVGEKPLRNIVIEFKPERR